MERDRLALTLKLENLNFNSHAHVERDLYFMSLLKPIVISTHTLTWSVTSYLSLAYDNIDISTHTLTWSVTFQ